MRYTVSLSLLLIAIGLRAQTPTWADDVACIFYSHCTTCHRPGGISGEALDLTSYTEAHDHRSDIQDWTSSGFMPPWPPDQGYRRMAHPRILSQDEIDIIAAWATGGGPEGNIANAPPPPTYSNAWSIADPDISLRMPDFTLPTTMTDDTYRAFVLHADIPQDVNIKRFEVIPGNNAAVHHVLVFQDTTGQAQQQDDNDPAPGYVSFGGIGVSGAELIGLWAPGASAWTAPPGMGIRLHAGADIVIQVHYPSSAEGLLDSTRVNFELDGSPVRTLAITAPLEHTITMTDGPLIIPPNVVRTFHNAYTVPFPATITSVAPHAHLLCQRMKAYGVTPSNDTIPFIDIPHWDFHWQGLYDFRRPIYLPQGTVLHGEATYDNTTANEDNPNDPPQYVTLGESTTDEMMLFFFAYTFGLPTDTNIVVDDSEHPAHYLDCAPAVHLGVTDLGAPVGIRIAPSPAHERFTLSVDRAGCRASLLNGLGQDVQHQAVVAGENVIDVAGRPAGTYYVVVQDRTGAVLFRGPVVLQ